MSTSEIVNITPYQFYVLQLLTLLYADSTFI